MEKSERFIYLNKKILFAVIKTYNSFTVDKESSKKIAIDKKDAKLGTIICTCTIVGMLKLDDLNMQIILVY